MKESFKITMVAVVGVLAGACSHSLIQNENTAPMIQSTSEAPPPDSSNPSSREIASNEPPEKVSELKYFDWPVDSARMTRGFLPNRRRPHLGIDLAAPKGTDVFASHDGVVIYTGREFKGYGKMVMIEGPNGWATLYAHFSKILVKEGQKVKQGDPVGEMGSTGRSTGSHVHFEIRRLDGPVDPMQYLPSPVKMAKKSANKEGLIN